MRTFYFQLDGNIIRDAIEYPFDGYTAVQLEVTHLPAGINAGYYRWNGTAYLIDEELRAQIEQASVDPTVAEKMAQLEERQNLMQAALDDLILGGGL
ncbi:hypothetical protein [Cohnella sp. AR92]|uniref:hypothetical protein n=1 Tax=Cohnella sp. AR92 TaxID=648716 RepID=UPI000F8DDD5D|nr:hypothetical protein [Cohnella sp. AR92]RUS47573.1 hypothetical protein ELR57_07195 [Cohnella sp. AR92]